jgi:hypothetical protein
MRATGILMAVTAILLAPSVASADPAPTQQPAETAMQPATAQEAAPPAVAASAVNLDEVVCRAVAPTTGSRLGGGRECHTVREWNQREQDSREALLRAQQLGYTSRGK